MHAPQISSNCCSRSRRRRRRRWLFGFLLPLPEQALAGRRQQQVVAGATCMHSALLPVCVRRVATIAHKQAALALAGEPIKVNRNTRLLSAG